jgi:hypothetical protein
MPANILVQGQTFSEFINGRLFLCVFPELNNDVIAKIKNSLQQIERINFQGSFIGFVNLVENLSLEEKKDFINRIKDFQNETFFEYEFDTISIVKHADDFLIKSQISDKIVFSKNKP